MPKRQSQKAGNQFIPFHGVVYLPIGSRGWRVMRKPWAARVVRRGKAWSCGGFEQPEEAARAYDNAAFYTTRWSRLGQSRLNFPSEYSDPDTRPRPTERTLQIVSRLQQEFPETTETPEVDRNSEIGLIEGTLFKLSQDLTSSGQLMAKTWMALVSKCRFYAGRIDELEKEVTLLKLSLEGAKSSIALTRVLPGPSGARVVSEAEAVMADPITDEEESVNESEEV